MTFQTLTWWLRGLRYLRYPALVRGLGELKTEWEIFDAVCNAYAFPGVRLKRGAVFENWTPERLELAEFVAIERGNILSWGFEPGTTGLIRLGAHTWVGPYNNLRVAGNGSIIIGSRCYISQFCSFISHNHGIKRASPIQLQPNDPDRADIRVGDDVWFGAGCTILPGARIATGAVLGAGAVVTKPIPEYEIWAGVPARKIGERN